MEKKKRSLRPVVSLILHVFIALSLSNIFLEAGASVSLQEHPSAFAIESYLDTVNSAEAITGFYTSTLQLDYNKLPNSFKFISSVGNLHEACTYCAYYSASSFNSYYTFISINAP